MSGPQGQDFIEQAQRAFEERDWAGAFECMEKADALAPMRGADLELLAEAARWAGQSTGIVAALERAHRAHVDAGDRRGAARTALALTHAHGDAQEAAMAGSWLQRASDILADLAETEEHGLLSWLRGRAAADRGDLDEHERYAREANAIAVRLRCREVEALALIDLGHVAAARGEYAAGLDFLDRATGIALSGEIGPLETGTVLCGAVWVCRCSGDWSRAEQWTRAADRWRGHEKVGYFPGLCRVHRAEVLRARGDLRGAERESLEAVEMLSATIPRWATVAHAELGEVRRRLGDFSGAMESFRTALESGWDPQPGLALLMLAQGDARSAHRAIERTFATQLPTWQREDLTALLQARASIAAAVGELEVCRAAVEQLESMAARSALPWEAAAAATVRGELELAAGRFGAAAAALLEAKHQWGELDAPYEMAAAAAALGRALSSDGDLRGAELEFAAARACFLRIGAGFEAGRVPRLAAEASQPASVAAAAPATSPSLVLEGDVWAVTWEGRTTRLRDARGMRYLSRLLARPDTDIACLELVADGRGAVPGEGVGDVLDAEAREAYRSRLADLEEELEQAVQHHDEARAAAAEEEIEALRRQLAAALGLSGRSRVVGSAAERARQSVTKALRGALHKLADEHPELGRHLETALRTGALCRYAPETSVRWTVSGWGAAGFTS